MKESMKHRLVGAAVLVGLGIIAWPVIFDTTPVREINRRSQIPDAPAVERFSVPEPAPVQTPPAPDSEALRAQAAAPDATATAAQATADSGKPEEPARLADDDGKPVAAPAGDDYGLPVQWAMQLGVFADLDNAVEVRGKAEKAGFHAVLQSVSVKGSMQHRVYIEPKLDRRALDALLPEVQRKLGIKGYVTPYYP